MESQNFRLKSYYCNVAPDTSAKDCRRKSTLSSFRCNLRRSISCPSKRSKAFTEIPDAFGAFVGRSDSVLFKTS